MFRRGDGLWGRSARAMYVRMMGHVMRFASLQRSCTYAMPRHGMRAFRTVGEGWSADRREARDETRCCHGGACMD